MYTKHTLTWKTLKPFIQATNLDKVVLPAPLTPINNKCPCEEDIHTDNVTTTRFRFISENFAATPCSEHLPNSMQTVFNFHEKKNTFCRESRSSKWAEYKSCILIKQYFFTTVTEPVADMIGLWTCLHPLWRNIRTLEFTSYLSDHVTFLYRAKFRRKVRRALKAAHLLILCSLTCGCLKILSILRTWSSTSLNNTKGTSNSSS